MANEATIITLLGNQGDPVEYTIAAGSNIAKGSLMILTSSPQTVQPHDGTVGAGSQLFMGIAAVDHTSGLDASTHLSVITNCIADITAGSATGDAMVLGEPVCTSASNNNTVGAATNDTIEFRGRVVGTALETVAADNTGAVRVRVL